MTVNELMAHICSQREKVANQSLTLREKLIQAYTNKVLHDIVALREKDESEAVFLDELKSYFKEHWDLFKGTCLSYTAIPLCDITRIMCAGAVLVAQQEQTDAQQEPTDALDILMPGVCRESLHGDIDDLESTDEDSLVRILSCHVLSADYQSLLPISILNKLQIEGSEKPLPNPFFDYETMKDECAWISENEYKRLICHSLYTEALSSAHKAYKQCIIRDDNTLLSQLTLLCAHLALNSAHNGGRGEQSNAAEGAYPAIISFSGYYEKLSDASKDKIPQTLKREIETLLNLSSDATENRDATSQLETCIGTRKERLVSEMHGLNALLHSISLSDLDNSAELEDRKGAFDAAKYGLRTALAPTQPNFYSGSDALPITEALFELLPNADFALHSQVDLQLLKGVSVDEVQAVLANDAIKNSMMRLLNSVENWVIFAIDISHEQLEHFLVGLKTDLLQRVFHTTNDLSAFLISLDIEKCGAIVRALGQDLIQSRSDLASVLEHLNQEQRSAVIDAICALIKTPADFGLIKDALTEKQRAIVIDTIGMDLVKQPKGLVSVFPHLSPAQRSKLIDELGLGAVYDLITDVNDLSSLLMHTTPTQSRQFINTLGIGKIGTFITGADELRIFLSQIDAKNAAFVLDDLVMQKKIRSIITRRDHLRALTMGHFTPKTKETISHVLTDILGMSTLRNLIKEKIDLLYAVRALTATQCSILFDNLEVGTLIKERKDLIDLSRILSGAQNTEALTHEKTKLRVTELVITIDNLVEFICGLRTHVEDRENDTWAAVLTLPGMADILLRSIKTVDDLTSTLARINLTERNTLLDNLAVDKLITKPEDRTLLLSHFTLKDVNTLQKVLISVTASINSVDALITFINLLHYKQAEEFFPTPCFTDILGRSIKTVDDLIRVRKEMNRLFFQPGIFHYIGIEEVCALIKTIDDFNMVKNYLSSANLVKVLCDARIARIVITTPQDLADRLQYHSPEECKVVLNALFSDKANHNLIEDVQDLKTFEPYSQNDPSSLSIMVLTALGKPAVFDLLNKKNNLAAFYRYFYYNSSHTLIAELLDNKGLTIEEQRLCYGPKGPGKWLKTLCPYFKSPIQINTAMLYWNLALLDEAANNLERSGKNEEGKKARSLSTSLKEELAEDEPSHEKLSALMSQASVDFKRSIVRKIIDCIINCFIALTAICQPQKITRNPHLFFPPDKASCVVSDLNKLCSKRPQAYHV